MKNTLKWKCPKCGQKNHQFYTDDDEHHCEHCDMVVELDFRITVTNVRPTQGFREIKVSRDKGVTWSNEWVDLREMDPNKSELSAGDWIELQDGEKFEVTLDKDGKLKAWPNGLQVD